MNGNENKEKFSIYSPGFVEPKHPENKPISPHEARQFVEGLGYQEEVWDNIMDQSLLSHEVRGLISIARQDGSRKLSDVYLEQYPDGNHYSAGDVQAEIDAAHAITDGQWEAFIKSHPENLTRF